MPGQEPPPSARPQPEAGNERVAYLDQALWRRLDADEDLDLEAWIALQCGMIASATGAVLVLGPPDVGPFRAAAHWPAGRRVSPLLSAVAELAVTRRRGIVQGEETTGAAEAGLRTYGIAFPVIADQRLCGVIAVEASAHDESDLRTVMRQLQWGAAWVELYLRRRQAGVEAGRQERVSTALELIADALEEVRFQPAALGVVTDLATRLGCERVSVGFLRKDRADVAAISHTAQFSRKMELVRRIAAAMDEALDQRSTIVWPAPEENSLVVRAHSELAQEHGAELIVTVPLYVKEVFFGAICLEFPTGRKLDPGMLELCETVGSVVGPILFEKRQNDRPILAKAMEAGRLQLERLLGPRYLGRKLALGFLLALVAFFALATGDYRVSSDAVLEGEVQRAVAAPLDGYVRSAEARAGDTVREGQLLATLEDQDLEIERRRWSAEEGQKRVEYDQALARGQRAEAQIIRAQIMQARSQVELLDEQLARTRMVAPFDGLVISGDLSQSIGRAVRRGEVLFEIAPLDTYRVMLEVDESDIDEIAVGQTGWLVITSMPDTKFGLEVERITPVSNPEEGRNYFRVEARLTDNAERLRPGMGGVAKIDAGRRKLIWIWTHGLADWLRLKTWAWWP